RQLIHRHAGHQRGDAEGVRSAGAHALRELPHPWTISQQPRRNALGTRSPLLIQATSADTVINEGSDGLDGHNGRIEQDETMLGHFISHAGTRPPPALAATRKHGRQKSLSGSGGNSRMALFGPSHSFLPALNSIVPGAPSSMFPSSSFR